MTEKVPRGENFQTRDYQDRGGAQNQISELSPPAHGANSGAKAADSDPKNRQKIEDAHAPGKPGAEPQGGAERLNINPAALRRGPTIRTIVVVVVGLLACFIYLLAHS